MRRDETRRRVISALFDEGELWVCTRRGAAHTKPSSRVDSFPVSLRCYLDFCLFVILCLELVDDHN